MDNFIKKIDSAKETLHSIYNLRKIINQRIEGILVLINEFKNKPEKVKADIEYAEKQLLKYNTDTINLDVNSEVNKYIEELKSFIERESQIKSQIELEDTVDSIVKNIREILTVSKNYYESLKYYQPIVSKFNKDINKINDMDYNNLTIFSNTIKSISEILNTDLRLVK